MFNRSCHYQNSTSEPFILAVFLQNKHFQRASLPRIKFQLHLFSKDQRKNEPFHKKKYQKQCHRIDFLVNTRYCTATAGVYFTKNLLPAVSFWYPAITTDHNITTSPCHNITMPPSIPLITKKLHFEDNASHYDAIA